VARSCAARSFSVFAASNEVPGDETPQCDLRSIPDPSAQRQPRRFTSRSFSTRGIDHEIRQMNQAQLQPLVSAQELASISQQFQQRMRFDDAFLSTYKGIVFQIRAEGVSLSDRRVVKLLKAVCGQRVSRGARALGRKRPVRAQTHFGTTRIKRRARGESSSRCSRRSNREHPDRSARWRGRR